MTGTLPFGISKLKKLKGLILGGNQFYGYLPEDLLIPSLEALNLQKNFFHGPFLNSPNNGSQLKEIYASYNLFSGTVPSLINEAKHLKAFLVSHNLFSGTISDNVVSSNQLERCKSTPKTRSF